MVRWQWIMNWKGWKEAYRGKPTKVSKYSVCSQHSNQAPHGSVTYRHWQLFVKPGVNIMPTDNFTSWYSFNLYDLGYLHRQGANSSLNQGSDALFRKLGLYYYCVFNGQWYRGDYFINFTQWYMEDWRSCWSVDPIWGHSNRFIALSVLLCPHIKCYLID